MEPKIKQLNFADGMILTTTMDGCVYSRPVAAFPLLRKATEEQLRSYTIGKFGDDVRWEALDEDIHISSLTRTRVAI